jgi:hypothetical protein
VHPFLSRVVNHRSEYSLAHKFRQKRFDFFLNCISCLSPPITILDVGGEQVFWERMGMAGDEDYQITLLNILPQATSCSNLDVMIGDAVDMTCFSDHEFDLVFSNSVIEHLGKFELQQRMAFEVRRVGKCYFIQTPNRFFPLEPHFLVPFFQYYPIWLQVALIERFNLGWYPRIQDPHAARRLIESHRLMNEKELLELFPDGQVYQEKIFWLIKSLTVYRVMAG